jgi:S-DNA-T family DNA segregation ATPase FtsK/SpoIIIE
VNKLPSVSETLSSLDHLKSVVQDFSAREAQLDQEFRARKAAESRGSDAAAKELAQQHADRIAEAQVNAHDHRARWEARFDRRKVRINEAHKRARRRAVEDVTVHEGRRKHKLQQNAMEAERRRDAELAVSTAAFENFKQQLGDSAGSLALLETTAAKAFAGFGAFKRLLSPNRKWPGPDRSRNENQLYEELLAAQRQANEEIPRFRSSLLRNLVIFTPPAWLLAVLLIILAALEYTNILLKHSGPDAISLRVPILCVAGLLIFRLVIYQVARQRLASAANSIAGHIGKIHLLLEVCSQAAEQRHQQEQQRIKTDFESTSRALDQEYKRIVKESIDLRGERPLQLDQKAHRVAERNTHFQDAKLQDLDRVHAEIHARVQQAVAAETARFQKERAERLASIETEQSNRWTALQAEWKAAIEPVCAELQNFNTRAEKLFPGWNEPQWQNWKPPAQFQNGAKFARLEVDIQKIAEVPDSARRLTLPCPPVLPVPLLLTYPREGSILFEGGKTGGEAAIPAMNNILFRLLATTPPGKLSFTIFDPVGLGQNFAGVMHLADYEDSNINSRIWTQTAQLEEKLAELNEHMEKVIQMYLRNEYETIAEYNAQAGSIAEKYHFLVIASFPVNFSDTAARRLRNIAASGARCGVYTLIHWDQRHASPQDFVPDELRKNSVRLTRTDRGFELDDRDMKGLRLMLDEPPPSEVATEFLHKVGEFGKGANRVEVPFEEIAPPPNELWKEETTEELRVPIGRSGATKMQYLAIGKGTRQHALIAGKTGSGKSTLFHVMITNLALWCSPEQVEFYLVDFKKGVEFKCYGTRHLPHARVVAIESDRQFGLSVLERVDAELRRRGDLFRKLGVQDLPGYKRAGGGEKLPRSLLMIDEFQEFFTEEDRISQGAAVLLDRIVRQGRAFGIHVLLGSQTLGGAYTLARATLGQMVIRIALQCNEADAYLIMDQDNPAPRLLSRPGEGIYNDAAGSIEGNNPFQVVWLSEDIRDHYLEKVRELADKTGKDLPGPFVFEGNAPADVRENAVLSALLKAASLEVPPSPPATSRIFLGAPNSIKGPTEAVFQPQSGANLILVGQSEEPTLAILTASLVSLAAQFPVGSVRLILLDNLAPGSPQADYLDRVVKSLSHRVERPKGAAALSELMTDLSNDLRHRSSEEENNRGVTSFLVIHGLENFKKLRQEDEFSFSSSSDDSAPNPAVVLQTLITEGPSHGIHLLITCDTFNNVSRFLGRKALSEFATRVLFQMSASDSAALIDAPDASTLGLHRAILYNDREGYLETFRPYARPGNDWLDEVARHLRALAKIQTSVPS